MNKKNKILVGCIALLLVLSVGYALFSETIEINGTATAKGNFDITATCEKGISSITGLDAEDLSFPAEGGYSGDSCSVVGNNVSFSASLNAPGAARYFTIKATNTGSIPATIAMNEDEQIFDVIIFRNTELNVCSINEDGSTGSCSDSLVYDGGESNPTRVAIAGFGDANGFYDFESDEMANFLDEETGELVLEPGESIYVVMGYYWTEDYKTSNNSANYTFDLTTEIPFVQFAQ